jgi:transcriptional regulator with XRE-family HTH domain
MPFEPKGFAMLFEQLNDRRKELRMSMAALARLSRVSLPTVQRLLSGKAPHASFAKVQAIAEVLGLRFVIAADPIRKLRRRRAEEKARRLVGMVQATSALEGQAVNSAAVEEMVQRTARELLDANCQTLWSE